MWLKKDAGLRKTESKEDIIPFEALKVEHVSTNWVEANVANRLWISGLDSRNNTTTQ